MLVPAFRSTTGDGDTAPIPTVGKMGARPRAGHDFNRPAGEPIGIRVTSNKNDIPTVAGVAFADVEEDVATRATRGVAGGKRNGAAGPRG